MAYDGAKPANDGYLADFPPEMREQLRAIINDQIVDAIKVMGLSPGNGSGNIPVNNGNLNLNLNAEKHGGKLVSELAAASHTHTAASASSDGFMSNTDKSKLDGVAASAEINQNAFSNVLVGSTTIQADAKTDTLELVGGTNIALTPDATNDRVTINVSGKVTSAGYADSADYAASAGSAPANGGTAATISGTITGNQVVANRNNTNTDLGTAKELRWRNYGNNHTIIDNSAGEYPGGTTNAQNAWSPSYPVLMGFNGSNTYGVRVDSARAADYASTAGSAPASGGTASYATFLNPLSGDSNYKLGYTADGQRTNAGEWGRVIMRYTPNGQTYGVRCDRADYADNAGSAGNADTVDGYHAASLMGGFDAGHSFATNGYQKLSNDLIIQWGLATNGEDAYVTFPVAFPNACLNMVVTFAVDAWGDSYKYDAKVRSTSKTQAHIYINCPNAYWIAIGY